MNLLRAIMVPIIIVVCIVAKVKAQNVITLQPSQFEALTNVKVIYGNAMCYEEKFCTNIVTNTVYLYTHPAVQGLNVFSCSSAVDYKVNPSLIVVTLSARPSYPSESVPAAPNGCDFVWYALNQGGSGQGCFTNVLCG
jgi:hypothetical protein